MAQQAILATYGGDARVGTGCMVKPQSVVHRFKIMRSGSKNEKAQYMYSYQVLVQSSECRLALENCVFSGIMN